MPEGDTIHHLAERLRPVLTGQVLEDVYLREVPGARRLESARVTAVRSVGKHLLIDADQGGAGWILRTHLGMTGRWRVLAAGRRRPRELRVALRVGETEAWCREAPQVEVFAARDEGRHPALSRLGPDLLGAWDVGEVMGRVRARAPDDVAAMLLDQSIAAGLGNVYKSEVLFRGGLHPATPVASLDDETIASLYRDGAHLLDQNKSRHRRVTTLGPIGAEARVRGLDLFVYERAGRPCVRCRTPVRVTRQGDRLRPTFWCPRCQPRP